MKGEMFVLHIVTECSCKIKTGRNRIVFFLTKSSLSLKTLYLVKAQTHRRQTVHRLHICSSPLSSVAGLLLANLCPSFNQELQISEFCCCVDFFCWIFDLYFRWKSSYGMTNVREKCTKTSRNFTR
ncbi:hypothetical protein L2E82_02797 [Cichorium intybus]|uniref:Uncharacterized protein n=1 Tax=Cichorium intybus TaxID=13427 RepID=A0ACB9H3H4_CICIN|nr:hypothetical protein L2E82_02797 [Cichorium intybus]